MVVMAQYENFDVTIADNAANVTIESTSSFNSLNRTLLEELLEISVALCENPSVRCITLTGQPDVFCAGADLSELKGTNADASTLRELASTLHDAIVQLYQAETPLITGVRGVAAGAGFSLAIFGDIVLMSDSSRFEYSYPRIGLTGDGGSTFFLPRLVGLRAAKEIVLLDEPISPERAAELGLVTRVVPDEDFEGELANLTEQVAAGPTSALGSTSRLLTESFDRSLEAQLAAETEVIAKAAHTTDYHRGHEAFFSDDTPEFIGE